jgi:hypothetical protein
MQVRRQPRRRERADGLTELEEASVLVIRAAYPLLVRHTFRRQRLVVSGGAVDNVHRPAVLGAAAAARRQRCRVFALALVVAELRSIEWSKALVVVLMRPNV